MCLNVRENIPTGCDMLDNLLEGGIQPENVILIYGDAETGKSTLAMQCAVNCARKGYKTLYLDCDGTFSVRRLSQIASKDFARISELIILMKPNNFREQTTAIDGLADCITESFGLVVVDTLTSLYRVKIAETPEKTFELNRELNRQMALLAEIAKTKKVAVLILSQVRSVFNETYVSVEPVATRVLKFWADTIIALKPTEHPQTIKAAVEKSPKKVEQSTLYLKINEKGICEEPFH